MTIKQRAASAAVACTLLLVPLPTPATAEEKPVAGAAGSETLRRAEAYYHLMRSTLAAGRGNIHDAVTAIREANKIYPDSAELQAESADLLMFMGQRVETGRLTQSALSAEAERLARSALRLDERQPTALRLLAGMAAARAFSGNAKARDEAIRLYGILVEDADADDETLRVLARLRFEAGDIDGALAAGRRLAAQRKGDVQVVQMMAQMLLRNEREAEALDTLLDFIARYREEPSLIPMVLDLARDSERWGQVEVVCAGLLERDPQAVSLRKLRGEALVQLRRYPEAVRELELALEQKPQDPHVLFSLTNAYDHVSRLAEATATARMLVEAVPGNPSVQAVLGHTLERQRDLEAALEVLQQALDGFVTGDSDPARRDLVRRRMAAILLERDRLEDSKRLIDNFEQPDDTEALEIGFRVALESGDYDAARRYTQRLRAQKNEGRAALLEGELLVREGRTSKARAKFKDAASKLGLSVWARVGEVWLRSEHIPEGESALRNWIRREPENPESHFALGAFLERAGDFGRAEEALRGALTLDPKHADALNYLGYSLADRKERLEEALDLIQRALEIDPWNGAYLDSLGWVYYRMGRYGEAREPLERAAREYPLDPTVLEHLGDLYQQLGEPDQALSMWRRALQAGPDDPEALERKIEASESPGKKVQARLPLGGVHLH